MQIIASILAEMFGSGELIDQTQVCRHRADAAAMRRLDGRGWSRAWRSARPGCTSPGSRSPGCWPRIRRPSSSGWTGRSASCARRSIRCWRPATWCGGEQREVLEAYRMFAQDTGWLRRIREAIGTGLSAEAAVRRVQEETRVADRPRQRPLPARAADRSGRHRQPPAAALGRQGAQPRSGTAARGHHPGGPQPRRRGPARVRPPQAARRSSSRRARRPRTSRSSPAPSASRWSAGSRARWRDRSPAIPSPSTATTGSLYVRPNDDVLQAFQHAMRARAERRRYFDQIRELPSVTAGRHPDHPVDQRRLPDRPGRASRPSAPTVAACSAPSSRS